MIPSSTRHRFSLIAWFWELLFQAAIRLGAASGLTRSDLHLSLDLRLDEIEQQRLAKRG